MFRRNTRQGRPGHVQGTGRLAIEHLEDRAMMSAVPAYNSLPGAPNTLYLNFDGDFTPVWNRTDSSQTYYNIASGEFNRDNTAGFNQSELNSIRAIWEAVAEDYSPFNVNVTTVEPPAAAFGSNQALRVVIAGNQSAMLLDPHFIGGVFMPFTYLSGNRFITNNHGASLLDTSGYSAIGSYTNAEPNVVFVFAAYTDTWSSTDSEGHSRDYDQLIATTASHEAGHAFGLSHHVGKDASGNASDYDVGNFLTTPIMGSNTSADRTIWSKISYQDSVQMLTSTLGARPDDVSDFSSSAVNVALIPLYFGNGSMLKNYSFGTGRGIIGTTSDVDWFHVSTGGGAFNFYADPVIKGNLDVRMDLYQRVFDWRLGFFRLTLLATSDPAIPSNQPFSGLNATISRSLGQGEFYVAIRSHGGYGDIGQYSFFVSRTDVPLYAISDPRLQVAVEYAPPTPGPGPLRLDAATSVSRVAAGVSSASATAVEVVKPQVAFVLDKDVPIKTTVTKKVKELAIDRVFANWV